MKKMYYPINIKSYVNNICSQKQYKELQNEWKELRKSIIETCVRKNITKSKAKKIFPPYMNRILLCNFSKLNEIFNYVDFLESYEKEFAKRIFNYDFIKSSVSGIPAKKNYLNSIKGLSTRSGKIADFFMKPEFNKNITTCFYCDANYINAYPAIGNTSNKKRKNSKRQFELDHFFEKEKCPITALSLFNLIPCCKICNGKSIKGSTPLPKFYNINQKNYNYDYFSPSSFNYQFEQNVKIRVIPIKGKQWAPQIGFVAHSSNYQIKFFTKSKIYRKEINAFFLEERYNYVNNKNEALNLLDLKQKYSDANISLIANTLAKNGIHIPATEIKEAIFHQRADKENHRIFGKMKEDILK